MSDSPSLITFFSDGLSETLRRLITFLEPYQSVIELYKPTTQTSEKHQPLDFQNQFLRTSGTTGNFDHLASVNRDHRINLVIIHLNGNPNPQASKNNVSRWIVAIY
jgi:hypothetical protein